LPQADKGWVSEVMATERKRRGELEADATTDSEGFVNPQRFGKEVEEFFGRDAIVAVDGGDIDLATARWLSPDEELNELASAPAAAVGLHYLGRYTAPHG
jgi:thiamine pyrophosphate-dependent acetolactate synthase large subunit-like protein